MSVISAAVRVTLFPIASFADDVASLLKVLILFDREENAAVLQTNFQKLILMIESSTGAIWPPEESSSNLSQASQVLSAKLTIKITHSSQLSKTQWSNVCTYTDVVTSK